MTDFRMTLKYAARDIASAKHQRATELERAIALLDEQRAKLQKELDEASSARSRFESYRPIIDDTYQCPVCWINLSEQSPLEPGDSSTDDDQYRCKVCGHQATHEI
jgi:rubredoxin